MLLITALLLVGISTYAQEQASSNIRYLNQTEIGVLAGPQTNSQIAPFSIMNINGVEINEKFAAGIGIGLEFINESYLPVFADVRYFFREENFSPFVGLQAGYSIALFDEGNIYYPGNIYYEYLSSSIVPYPYPYSNTLKPSGGIMMNPSVGFKNMMNDNLGFTFSLGYRYQRLTYNNTENDDHLLMELNRLTIKVGFIFN